MATRLLFSFVEPEFTDPESEARGRAIYEQVDHVERAGDLLAEKGIRPERDGIAGWVVVQDRSECLIRFVGGTARDPRALYDVRFVGQAPPTLRKSSSQTLTDAQQAQLQARDVAMAQIRRGGGRFGPGHFVFAYFKSVDSADLLVYALRVPASPNEIPLGGHYRFVFSPDGKVLTNTDTLPWTPGHTPLQQDLKRILLSDPSYYNRPLSRFLIETQIYLSLRHQVRIDVGTQDRPLWKVDEGKIALTHPYVFR